MGNRVAAAVPYRILGQWSAMKNDGSCFTDHDVHAVLKAKGKQQLNAGEDRNEWFKCTLNDVKAAVVAVQTGAENVEERTQTFAMRPEQEYAVDMTMKYFKSAYEEVWNAMMLSMRQRLSRWDPRQQQVYRQFVSDAEIVTLDSNGRFLLSRRCQEFAGISQQVSFIGMGDSIEIWAREKTEQPFMDQEEFGEALSELLKD